MKNHVAIPVEVINKVIHKSNFEDLRLFFFLKHMTSGHLLLTNESIEFFCTKLQINTKTFHKYISILLKNQWITINSKTNNVRIISTSQLAKKLKIKSKKIALYRNPSFSKEEFKAFVCAVSLTYYAEYLKGKMAKNMKTFGESIKSPKYSDRYLCNKGGTSKNLRKRLYTPPYLILPTEYFAKQIKKNQSTASRYKNLAAKYQYIEVEHIYQDLSISPKDAFIVSKRKDHKGFLKIRGKKVQLQLPDKIVSNIHIVNRKNLLK